MTVPISRADIVDYVTYEDSRSEARTAAMAAKAPRRVHLAGCLTLLFENRATLIYQVQEILRAERIVREASIRHEIDCYNALLGGPGELGCVLLIEIPEAQERAVRLRQWLGLAGRVYAVVAGGERAYASWDEGQISGGKLSAVQYLRFALPAPPVAVGTDFAPLASEVILNPAQQAALAADLAASHEPAPGGV